MKQKVDTYGTWPVPVGECFPCDLLHFGGKDFYIEST